MILVICIYTYTLLFLLCIYVQCVYMAILNNVHVAVFYTIYPNNNTSPFQKMGDSLLNQLELPPAGPGGSSS